MNFDSLSSAFYEFYQSYTIVVVVLAIGLVIWAYRNPKESLKFFLFLLFMAAVLFAISLFSDTVNIGSGSKRQMIHKTEQADQ
ncbi:MAG TPA: hypothetical protein VJ995_05395 [Geothermobacteraceae bacterium]|nr:hypothetical protein [Geothermobacteraceae bacterium]